MTKRGSRPREYGRRHHLIRERDGCRVWTYNNKIEVEVSLPRVLGLFNDEQDRMSEVDVLRAARMVTSDLFPSTTQHDARGNPNGSWQITRLDLAVNFTGQILEFVETYRHARRKQSASKGLVFGESSIGWYGTDYDLILYDPSERPPRGKPRAALKDKRFRPGANRVRAELRFKTPRALKRLISHFGPDERGLPFLASCTGGASTVQSYGLDHHRLQQVLATELDALGRGSTRTMKGGKMKPVTRLCFERLEEHPERWAEMKLGYEDRRYRQFRQEFTAWRMVTKVINIVNSGWSRPREHPWIKAQRLKTLQRNVLAQRKRCPEIIDHA